MANETTSKPTEDNFDTIFFVEVSILLILLLIVICTIPIIIIVLIRRRLDTPGKPPKKAKITVTRKLSARRLISNGSTSTTVSTTNHKNAGFKTHEESVRTNFQPRPKLATALIAQNNGSDESVEGNFEYRNYNIKLSKLAEKVTQLNLNTRREFIEQYTQFSKDMIRPAAEGVKPENKPKNRFANIIPYDHSRVFLQNTTELEASDYVNANYIHGYYKDNAYIASQSPMPSTVIDFWTMIWQQKVDTIVILTKIFEATKKRCEIYWPQNQENFSKYGSFNIRLLKHNRTTFYDIRELEVINASETDMGARQISLLHYTAWPDHGTPVFTSSVIDFILLTKQYHHPFNNNTPILVHCSAGVGRTGTFIVLDYILEEIKYTNIINIFKVVSMIRENRCHMVQTLDQYVFIHEALVNHLICNDTFINDHDFKLTIANMKIRDNQTLSTGFETNYELLMRVSKQRGKEDCLAATSPENRNKNRYDDYIPFDMRRVKLDNFLSSAHHNDYINASYVDRYQAMNSIIIAQGPINNTIEDFWKMIIQCRVRVIIMLCDLVEEGLDMSSKYWPEFEEVINVSKRFVVTLGKEEKYKEFALRQFVLKNNNGDIVATINQIQFLLWTASKYPPPQDILTLYHHLTQLERMTRVPEGAPILVHCNDGSSRSGTFVVCVSAIEQLDLEKRVDLFQIVKNLRKARPYTLPTLDLYIYAHEIICEYIKMFEERAYKNFEF